MAARKKTPAENEPDVVDSEVVSEGETTAADNARYDAGSSPLATIPQQEQALHYGIATLALSPEQQAIIRAPIAEAEIDFRWGDKAKTYALAYAPQVMMRRRLCEAFPGSWGLRVLKAFTSESDDGERVLLHGALYIQGRFVAEAMGEAAYLGRENKNASYATAWESAKSDCLGRCCKDLGMFAELWDRKFTKPLEQAWIKSHKKKCPKCGNIDAFTQKKDDESIWFCWRNPSKGKDGCGWEGNPDEATEVRAGTPAGPGAPAAQAVSPRSAQPPGPSAAPTLATPITTAVGGPATQDDRAKLNPLQTQPGPGPRPVPFDEWLEQNAAAGMVEQLTATHLRICLSNKTIDEQERALAIQYILAAKDKQTACAKMVERLKQLAEEREVVDDDLRHIQPRTHAHRTVRGRSR